MSAQDKAFALIASQVGLLTPETLARALYKSALRHVQRKPKPGARGAWSWPRYRAEVLVTLPAVAASLGATGAPKALRRIKKLIERFGS